MSQLREIANIIALEENIPLEVAVEVVKSLWEFIREKIKDLPLKNQLTEEEFNKLRTNFNLPSLGKLYVTYDTYEKTLRKFKYIQELRNERIED